VESLFHTELNVVTKALQNSECRLSKLTANYSYNENTVVITWAITVSVFCFFVDLLTALCLLRKAERLREPLL
jgi:hypothetical protein